jgi:hypothetical protein
LETYWTIEIESAINNQKSTTIQQSKITHSTMIHQARRNPCFEIGSDRMRFPVAAQIALASAGMVGGNAG